MAHRAPRAGIVGAGQLARMTYQAGISLGLTVRLLAGSAAESAARVARDVVVGEATAAESLGAFAAECDVLTFDHELVDAVQLAALEASGHCLRPGADTVGLAQDKRRQRVELSEQGFPVPPFRAPPDTASVERFAAEHGWPVVLKAIRGGYDGRGVWVVGDVAQAAARLHEAADRSVELLVEAWVPIERELAVLVARRPGGETVVYPVVETVQVDGICHEVLAPAPIAPELAREAQRLGRAIAEAVGATGVLAVELFVSAGRLLVNELAARPHNSGHYSIEGCVTSQFENHLRAILDWPLGDPSLVASGAAMVNILGCGADDPRARLPAALDVPGVHVHLYDKPARAGRKRGHITATGADITEARGRARRAVDILVGKGAAGEGGA
ncbi:MAG: 5-(carboxyamino)imidazole ribonucleotide synthase [Chloroflexota bacterium]|nr:5-(carboxyamino)imidazole ribonucleotide synthase [Chloroflexota bacterium]